MKAVKGIHFWKPKESFLILEISPEEVNGLLLGLDADKKITPRQFLRGTDWARLAKRPALRHLVTNVIVSADSTLAYTASIPVSLKRENPRESLSVVELENILAQTVGRAFNQCRQEAARYLKMDDLDVVLANSRVVNFKIDGHRVLNPLGFQAEKIEAALELTLTTRGLFEEMRRFLSAGWSASRPENSFFFIETAEAELSVIHKVQKLPLSMVRLGHFHSTFSVLEEAAVGHLRGRGKVRWTAQEIIAALQNDWRVTHTAAEKVYHLFLRNETSSHGRKAMEKILAPAAKDLLAELQKAKLKGNVFLDSPLPLPFGLPVRRGKLALYEPPLGQILEHFGFELRPEEWPVPAHRIFRFAAPFLEYYYDRSDLHANRWLRRHLNWLGASV